MCTVAINQPYRSQLPEPPPSPHPWPADLPYPHPHSRPSPNRGWGRPANLQHPFSSTDSAPIGSHWSGQARPYPCTNSWTKPLPCYNTKLMYSFSQMINILGLLNFLFFKPNITVWWSFSSWFSSTTQSVKVTNIAHFWLTIPNSSFKTLEIYISSQSVWESYSQICVFLKTKNTWNQVLKNMFFIFTWHITS